MTSRHARTLIPVLLVLVAGALRVIALGQPDRIIFDETYYAEDARYYLMQGVEEGFSVHPPVGKWLIAAGIQVFGDDAFGWRIAAAVAGALLVLLVYLMAGRLLRWRGAAALAAILAATDGLLFVQSRISMLDIFLAMFVALGAWLLLVDHDHSGLGEDPRDLAPRRPPDGDELEQLRLPVQAGGADDDPGPVAVLDPEVADERPRRDGRTTLDDLPTRSHPYRWLAGLAFGLAIATKWSGLLPMAAAALVVLGWELAWRRRLGLRMRTGMVRLLASLFLVFVLVPAGVYVVSYIPWLANYAHTSEGDDVCVTDDGEPQEPCHVSIPGRLKGLVDYQVAIFTFHQDLEADHPYRAPAYTWPVMGRPVVYYWETCSEERAKGVATTNDEGEVEDPEPCRVEQGNAGEIIALGNPVLWWLSLAALVPLAIGAWKRDRRAWFIIAFWAVQFVPWLIVSRPVFFFYMVPVVPFLALAVAYAVRWIDEVRERRALRRGRPLRETATTPGAVVGAVIAVLAVAAFVYFYPVLTGLEMDYDAVRQRWWFDSWI